jgi:coenzyme F420-reducing hydrogenase delta subunit/NAD-dependent dihydropyrimidine dehydrogenase PreA subunit
MIIREGHDVSHSQVTKKTRSRNSCGLQLHRNLLHAVHFRGISFLGRASYPVFDLDVCRACGACAAECPAVAVEFVARPDEDLLVRLDAALAEGAPAGPVSFVCSYSCAVGLAEDSAERTVVLPCLNRLSEPLVLKAYERGAASVVVGSCFPEGCQYGASADTVERRLAQVTQLLESVGLSFERQETCDLEVLAGVAGGDGA